MLRTVDVEHSEQLAIADQRNDNLAVRCAVAGDVAGEGVDVFHQLNLTGLRRDAADAGSERDADTSRAALERPQHQLATDISVEADPIDVGQAFPNQRGGIGHVGDAVRFAVDETAER